MKFQDNKASTVHLQVVIFFSGHAYSLERRESSNSEIHSSHDRELSNLQDSVPRKKGMVLPFQPLSMAFENINYYVDMPEVGTDRSD